MRILTFTSLYPDAARPRHGIFIENRIRELAKEDGVSVRVVAPCPWFPVAAPAAGDYSKFALVPRFEVRHGIEVDHPRYLVIPKIGMSVAPALLYAGARRALARIATEAGGFDLIDAHYFYPDGVAAVMLARHFGTPVTITARGSDLNILPRFALPRRMIRWAARRADGLVTVSAALRERLVDLGIARDRVSVLRNGVDLALFHPRDRAAGRARLGLDGTVLLSVGNLVPIKGHELTIAALRELPEARLAIVGDGPERQALQELADQLSLGDRVRFLGNVAQHELPEIYSAADAMVLASRHEGWPNVVLEALACGTPVVASDIPGMGEIIQSPRVGRLFAERTPAALAGAVRVMLQDAPSRDELHRYARSFGWQATTAGQLALFRSILGRGGHGQVAPAAPEAVRGG